MYLPNANYGAKFIGILNFIIRILRLLITAVN